MSSPWSAGASPALTSAISVASDAESEVDEQDQEPELEDRPVLHARLSLEHRSALLGLSFPANQFPLPDYRLRLLAPELLAASPVEVRVSPLATGRELLAEQGLARELAARARAGHEVRLRLPGSAADDPVWLDERLPLWCYDLGEPPLPAQLELRTAPPSPLDSSYCDLVVLLGLPAAGRRRVHVDASLPCRQLAQQLNSRLHLAVRTADLPHHALFLCTGVAEPDERWWAAGWWLAPDLPLQHFQPHTMDLLALRPCPLVRLQGPAEVLDLPLSLTVQQLGQALATAAAQAGEGPWAVAHDRSVPGGYYDSDTRSARWLIPAFPWSHSPPQPGDSLELSRAAAARYGAEPPIEPLARFAVVGIVRPTPSPAPARVPSPPARVRSSSATPALLAVPETTGAGLSDGGEDRAARSAPGTRRLSFSVPEAPSASSLAHSRDASQLALEPGEQILIPATDAALVPAGEPPLEELGQLLCTSARLYFVHRDSSRAELRVALHSLSRVERVGLAQLDLETKAPYTIRIRLRGQTGGAVRNRLAELLTTRAWPEKLTDLFAFVRGPGMAPAADGWEVFVPRDEWTRVLSRDLARAWRISSVNADHALCASYPSLLVVPAVVSDDQLRPVFAFRSKGRVPVLTYLHSTGAALCRSSQPKPGFGRTRCSEDERLLEEVARLPTASRPPALALFDVRPRMHAMANTALGAGTENTAHYPFLNVQFIALQNIHAMRDSQTRLQQVCAQATDWSGEPSQWLSALDRSDWLSHLRLLLFGAVQVALTLHRERTSVLVHCSDGWDRTAQVVALAQLLLEPHYRTLRGFQTLVEKDWLAFGHKFHIRCGHAVSNPLDEGRAPIFLQFIDCTFQLLSQFPCAFEFNEHFLLDLMDALYACHHGTFLCNNQLERHTAQLRARTSSFWSEVNAQTVRYTNPHYFPGGVELLLPDLTSAALRFWSTYYLRTHRKLKEGDVLSAEERAMQLKMSCESLYRQLQEAERELKQLRAQKRLSSTASLQLPGSASAHKRP